MNEPTQGRGTSEPHSETPHQDTDTPWSPASTSGPPDDPDLAAAEATEIARKDAAWATHGDEFEAHRLADVLAGTPAPGGSSVTGSEPHYRTPKHLRTTSGPRFSGRGVLAVFGILGILLTLGIMAFLAVKVLDSTSGADSPSAAVPGLPAVPGAPGVPDGAGMDPDVPLDATATAACQSERATIETVIQGYEVLNGEPPGSLDALEAEGFLQAPDGGFSFELSADGTLNGTGACSGV